MTLDVEQFERLIAVIENLAAGDLDARFPISPRHDDVDAIGFAVNTLAEELSATILQAEREASARRKREGDLQRAERRQSEISEELRNLRMARLASIGSLAAGIGHEINNPLTYVIGNLDLLRLQLADLLPDRNPGAEEVHELLREASEGAERIRRIVRDLRLFTRVDDEPDQLIDVREVMESSLALVGNEIRHRATLERDYQDVPSIWSSEARLAQVFVNLLVNAAHSIPAGDVSSHAIHIRIARQGTRQLVVDISDTGTGIPEADLPRIFDPFFSTKPRGEGTGLGLPVCSELLSNLGGSISVKSSVPSGTTFTVVVPVRASRPMKPTGEQPAPLAPSSRSQRVLIIDDDAPVAATLQRMLGGVESKVVSGGREALEILEGGDAFDLIFCDLMMPDVTGMDLFEAVKERAPDLLERFVFVTGGAFSEHASEFLAAVPNPCLAKPFDPAEIAALLGGGASEGRD